MTNSISTILLLTILFSSCGQSQPSKQIKQTTVSAVQNPTKEIVVGGPCDQCETIFEGMPAPEKINWETTIANKNEPGTRMEINGTVLMKDGKTPAKKVILYLYHTDATGHYTPSDTQTVGRRNGHLRGWVKTNDEGKFKLYSIRPAPYPTRNIPAHIHILVKEQEKTRYYLDEVWFDDDLLITKNLRDKAEKRGGDLIIHLAKNKDDVWSGNLIITLGLNIPNYN